MSRQLAVSAALSVLAMAAFALFDPHAAGSPASRGAGSPFEIAAPALPGLPATPLLPR
ncbi:MAG: hypothetical protein KGL44_06305 [Sphingomonadales bacterium]|nr:hypothetical protein [Sphingomonadales bacterium]